MKVCIIQPAYSTDYEKSQEYFEAELELLNKCDDSMDLIVLPEASDIPCLAKTKEQSEFSSERFTEILLKKVSETAKRCNAIVFVNGRYMSETGLRNTTYAFNRQGEIAGKYFKQHLTPGEVSKIKLDSDYTFEFSEPTVIEIEGIRFGFLTCYDFYFYEAFANMARYNSDAIIGCSHQRSDTHEALKIMSQFLAYNTNTYVIRSSVSMDENSDIGGASMIVAPNGKVLANMYSRVGMECVDIDLKKKYYKPAGFGGELSAHYEYIEKGRRPWKYRPAGSAIVKPDELMPYPRICVSGENAEAFGKAFMEDIHEITFSIDNPSFEKILRKLSCHVIMNINADDFAKEKIEEAISYIHKYDCGKYVYFTSKNIAVLKYLSETAPNLERCYFGNDLKTALKYNCSKIQILDADKDLIDKAHKNNMRCILKTSESKVFDMGIDTILTNDYNIISQIIK